MSLHAESRMPAERIAMVGTLVDTMLGFRAELIRDMVAAGHHVYAFATDYCPETESAIRAMGAIPVSYRMTQLGTNPISDLMAVWQLRKLFVRHQISLSYCYFSKPAIYGTLAARLARVPRRVAKIEGLGRVFTVSPSGDKFRKKLVRKIMARLFRFSLPMAHKVYVLNEGDKEDLQRFGVNQPEPEVLGGIGVCLDRYYFCPPVTDTIRFIFVARLLHEKGVRYFVNAAKALGKRYPSAEFILLGAPDARPGAVDKAELRELVSQGVVRYPGAVKDVTPWLAESSVFVLPSYYREGVPRSTQEALAMGRPVITTDMPGCRRTVRDGVNGLLVPAHDQEALEEAMITFIKKPELVRSMGLASFNYARENFDVREINRRILREIGISNAVSEKEEPQTEHESSTVNGLLRAQSWR